MKIRVTHKANTPITESTRIFYWGRETPNQYLNLECRVDDGVITIANLRDGYDVLHKSYWIELNNNQDFQAAFSGYKWYKIKDLERDNVLVYFAKI